MHVSTVYQYIRELKVKTIIACQVLNSLHACPKCCWQLVAKYARISHFVMVSLCSCSTRFMTSWLLCSVLQSAACILGSWPIRINKNIRLATACIICELSRISTCMVKNSIISIYKGHFTVCVPTCRLATISCCCCCADSTFLRYLLSCAASWALNSVI